MNSQRKILFLPPLVVFVAVMVVVASSFFVSLSSVRKEQDSAALENMELTESAVSSRLNIYEEVLRAGVGLFAGSSSVSKDEWADFVDASDILERFDGTQGIGYTKVVLPRERATFIEAARRTIDPNFSITPSGEREIYTSIMYLEPLDERNQLAIGFDMYSEAVRQEAMTRARDSGEITVSGAVRLVQENGQGEQMGFLMYAPHYAANLPHDTLEERQKAIEGYVYAAFRAQTFLDAVLSQQQREDFAYEIKKPTGDGQVTIYKTDDYDEVASDQSVQVSRTVSIKASEWKFAYAYRPDRLLPQSVLNRPLTVLLFGVFSAFLITGVTYLLLRGKSNELALAKERETNEAKDNLLSIASHQLRTPATGVKQYLGMVLQGFAGDISGQQEALLEKAYESNERQLKTINDVLYLARLDSGRIVLTKSRIEVRALVRSIIDELQNKISESQHKLQVSMPRKNVYVQADEHMLRMAIENLLTNAIKYTKNKGRIRIRVQRVAGEVTIAVMDNGVGIKPEDLDLLFKEFSRIPNELSKSVSGTGIGLYLARHLMLRHDGDIEVKSEAGVGSTFTIHLPIG